MKLTSKLLKKLIKEQIHNMSEASEFDQKADMILKKGMDALPDVMGGILLPAIMTGALLDMGKFREEHGMEVANTISNLSEDEILVILDEYGRFNQPKKRRMARELSMMSVDEIMSKFGSAEFNSAMRRYYKAEMAPQKTPAEQLPPAEQSDLFKENKITKKLRKIIKEEMKNIKEADEGGFDKEALLLFAPLGALMTLVGIGLYGSLSSVERDPVEVSQVIERMPQEEIYKILQRVRVKNERIPDYIIKSASVEISQMSAPEIETMMLEDSDFKFDFYSVTFAPSEELKLQKGNSIYRERLKRKKNA